MMTSVQIEELIKHLKSRRIHIDKGLTDNEVEQVQTKYDFLFPPDLRAFLQMGLPVSANFYDWRRAINTKKAIAQVESYLALPWEGVAFDIEHNAFWYEAWGEMPADLPEKLQVGKAHFQTYPKLVPVFSHRYMPCTDLPDSPVFSVHQTDIIYYGYNLANYFATEFNFKLSKNFEVLYGAKHQFPFWTWCVER